MAEMNNKQGMGNKQAANTPNTGVKKELSYDDKVIEKIVGIATDEIPGILTMTGGIGGAINNRLHVTNQQTSGIDAEVGKKQVALDLNVVCEYGQYVPGLLDTIVQKVSQAVKSMTGLEVIEVNMHVQDIMSRDEFEKTQQQQNKQMFGGQDQQQQPQQNGQSQSYTANRVQ